MIGINMFAGIMYFIKSKNEIPFMLALFNVMVEYRLISVELGYSSFVTFNYGISFSYGFDIAYSVSNLILLGTTVMMYSFMIFDRKKTKNIPDNDNYLQQFVQSRKTIILGGLGLFSVFQLLFASNISDGYGNLAKLGNTSFIILLYLVFIFTKTKKPIIKIAYLIGFVMLARITWSASMRFQFLGWMIPIAYYLLRRVKPFLKVLFLTVGVVVMMLIFSISRTIQYNPNMNFSQLTDASLQRMMVADDVNFIDGFMMMYQIYPQFLDYRYGLEHVNIFLRPIPRTLWPDKPLAGWFQQYAQKYHTRLFVVGFSSTIYGVFYAEGGTIGVIIFSVFWGWMIAYFYRSFGGFNSVLSYICIGILLASLIPILRSGDMPGDFAIVLMSYWPFIIFVRQYKKFIKKQTRIEMYKRAAIAA
jgi:oligosaccharide repeat unit polymerase